MAKQKALITGASAGIGRAYAHKLAARGFDLVLVARDTVRLEALAGELRTLGAAVEILVADLSQSADVRRVEEKLEGDPAITLFLNNAGIATVEPQLQTPVETIEKLIALNVTAAIRLALAAGRAFTAGQNSNQPGTLINMASAVAINPERFNAVYSASKAAILALTKELNDNGVRIQTVLPGATRTEIWERAGKDVNSLPQERVMEVDELVDAALKGLEMGETITIPSLPDAQDLADAEAARLKLGPNLSWRRAAARYKS
jgi:short-subunit dehydrogenase